MHYIWIDVAKILSKILYIMHGKIYNGKEHMNIYRSRPPLPESGMEEVDGDVALCSGLVLVLVTGLVFRCLILYCLIWFVLFFLVLCCL